GIHLALQLSPLPLRLEPLAACAVRATGGLILLRDGLKKLNHYKLAGDGVSVGIKLTDTLSRASFAPTRIPSFVNNQSP
ncbi:hypothetical protein, partial [Pseudomonas sp. TNT3]|uniref:hypothetical protein n=1 Tax=Pseudomonas sp. TNT3 TaxID=2654097 RepID=UPI001C49A4D9